MPISRSLLLSIALIASQLGQVAYALDDAIDVGGGLFDKSELGTSADEIGIEPVLDGPAESIGIPDLPAETAPAEEPKRVRKRRSKSATPPPEESAEKEKETQAVKAPEQVINDFSDASPSGVQATSQEIANHAEGVIGRVKELQKVEAAKQRPTTVKKTLNNSEKWARDSERKKASDATKSLQKRIQDLRKSIEAPGSPKRKPLSKRS